MSTHLLSSSEAADLLRMLPARVVRLAKRGAIPCVLLPDGEIRFDVQELAAWVEQHKQPATEAAR